MRVWLLMILIVPISAWASGWRNFVVDESTPVYQKPSEGSKVIFHLKPGSRVRLSTEDFGEFQRVLFPFKRRWYQGYIRVELSLGEDQPAERSWAVGFGGFYGRLSRGAKSFTTSDQVNYAMSAVTSQSISPSVFVQTSDTDFWRLILSYKMVHYQGSATKDVVGSSSDTLDIKETFVSAVLQRAWTWRHFYVGIGGEAAKALSTTVSLGSVNLNISSDQYPVYIGPQVFLGTAFNVGGSWSGMLEGRYGMMLNQDPAVQDIEASLLVSYWL